MVLRSCFLSFTRLGIGDDLDAWWNHRSNLPALQRLSEFFHYLLSKTPDRLVIFADEIEWTIQFPFSDNFFAAIRACYNARATKPEYERLTFVLLGVASPSDLIKDRTRTPFNIGRRIDLTDFSHKEASPLAWGLNADPLQAQQVLDRIVYWTSDHPYLTQTLCELPAKTQNGTAAHGTVDRPVYEHFLSPKANRDINLEFVRNRILEDKHSRKLLRLYRAIYQNAKVLDDPLSPIHSSLTLSGLVVPGDGGALAVRNRIYERVFTDQWAKEAMPTNWSRRVAVASLAALVLGFGVWYEVLQPRPYIETLQTASEDYQVSYQAYQNLHSIFGYGGKADRLLAEFWDRRSVRAQARGDRDTGLLATIQALNVEATETRRRQATLLAGSDYADLVSTYRHGGTVGAVVFSPDGKLALTGSSDQSALFWRADTGGPVNRPLRHDGTVRAVAFSPNGKLALTGGDEGTARIWDVSTGKPIGPRLRHQGTVWALAFSPDSTRVLTCSGDQTAKLWDVKSGDARSMRHDCVVGAVAFSPDRKLALTGSDDRTARLWDVATGKPKGTPLRHEVGGF